MTQALSKHGIGASEVAAIAGLNPYCSPWDVWLKKTGQAPEEPGNENMEWGLRLEPAIRQKYVDETGHNVLVPTESMFHRETKWARATPDGIGLRGADWTHLVQCKNVGGWVEKAWSAAPPVYVQLQEMWEMFVTGLARADVAVLIGGNQFRIYTVHRDQKQIDDLVTIADDFWRKVESRTPPPIDASDACADHFRARIPKADAVDLVADGPTEELFALWRSKCAEAKRLEGEIETIRNSVLASLADAQADRITSTIGAATLRPSKRVAWRSVANALGESDPVRLTSLIEECTTETLTLYAPREWAKETP